MDEEPVKMNANFPGKYKLFSKRYLKLFLIDRIIDGDEIVIHSHRVPVNGKHILTTEMMLRQPNRNLSPLVFSWGKGEVHYIEDAPMLGHIRTIDLGTAVGLINSNWQDRTNIDMCWTNLAKWNEPQQSLPQQYWSS